MSRRRRCSITRWRWTGRKAEALLICCTDFNTVDAIEPLEETLGKPVVTSNTATLWASLRTLGIEDRIEGCGRLLREF